MCVLAISCAWSVNRRDAPEERFIDIEHRAQGLINAPLLRGELIVLLLQVAQPGLELRTLAHRDGFRLRRRRRSLLQLTEARLSVKAHASKLALHLDNGGLRRALLALGRLRQVFDEIKLLVQRQPLCGA